MRLLTLVVLALLAFGSCSGYRDREGNSGNRKRKRKTSKNVALEQEQNRLTRRNRMWGGERAGAPISIAPDEESTARVKLRVNGDAFSGGLHDVGSV